MVLAEGFFAVIGLPFGGMCGMESGFAAENTPLRLPYFPASLREPLRNPMVTVTAKGHQAYATGLGAPGGLSRRNSLPRSLNSTSASAAKPASRKAMASGLAELS